jgi:superfamily II DNA or RNA helicase
MRIVEELYQHGFEKVVFIAHRHRLLNQALDYIDWMGLRDKLPNLNFKAVSIYEKNIYELKNADLVIFDEAHHSACDSGIRLVDKINPRRILGLTATNWRSDRIKLVFEKLVEDYGINSLIEMGYLAKYDHYMIEKWDPVSVVNTYLRDQDVFGKSIMYFHTTEESEYAVSLLKAAGVAAESIYGTSVDHVRENIYSRFESGETKVLCNLLLLTEGVDFPDLKTVFVKPSIKGLTIQMAGRALRLAENKTFANVVQMAGDGYSFSRVAGSRESYVRRDGRWVHTTFSREFLNKLGASTLKYKLALSKDLKAMESLHFTVNEQHRVNLAFLDEHRSNAKAVPDLEELAALSEGDWDE